MKKRPILSVLLGTAIIAAAGYLVWANLGARPPAKVLATVVPSSVRDQPSRTSQQANPRPSDTPGARPGGEEGASSAGGAQRAEGAARRRQPHPVRVVRSERGTLENVVTLTGEVAAANRVDVYPEVAGKVARINVEIGTRVVPETVLLTVDPSRPGTRFEASPVRSPIAGTVVDLLVKRGQSVASSTPAVTVATVGDLELVVRLPERYAQIVSPQTLGTVRFDTLDGRRFTAGVKRLQPVIDPVSRSKELVFAIPAGSRGVEPGMFGTVELVSRRLENVVVVPFEAVVQETNAAYLFVAHDGAVAKRKVDLGMLAGERVEIRSGVDAGENVVVSGQTFLDDGSPVSIVDQGSGDPGSTRGRSQASPK